MMLEQKLPHDRVPEELRLRGHDTLQRDDRFRRLAHDAGYQADRTEDRDNGARRELPSPWHSPEPRWPRDPEQGFLNGGATSRHRRLPRNSGIYLRVYAQPPTATP